MAWLAGQWDVQQVRKQRQYDVLLKTSGGEVKRLYKDMHEILTVRPIVALFILQGNRVASETDKN